jgi:hypothetical protein
MKWSHAALRALAFTPALWLGLLVFRYGVDVPYNDQWEELDIVQKALHGGLTLRDLWMPHNEHRIFFPRLVFVALARLTHWNVRVELAAIVGAACVIAWNLQVLLRRTWPAERYWPLAASFLVNLLVFSPIQHQNWLWGFQLQFLAPIVCLTSILALPPAWSRKRWAAAAGALATVSSFSLASGFLAWLASLPLWVARATPERRLRAGLAWCLGLGACLALYLHGYTAPRHHFEQPSVLARPGLYLITLVGMLGQPLALTFHKAWFEMAVGLGAVVVSAYGFLVVRLAFERDRWGTSLAWACLGAQALSSCALIALGRAGAGSGSVFASRYTTPSLYLLVSVFVLGLLAAERRGSARWARLVGGLVLVLWAVPAGRQGRDDMENRYVLMARAKAELVLAPLFPQTPFTNHLGVERMSVLEKGERLQELGVLRPSLRRDPSLAKVATVRPGACGSIEEAYPERQRVRLLGSAWLPRRPSVADVVLLTYRKKRTAPVVFAWAESGRSRPDLAETLDCPVCVGAGWEARFWLPASVLPVEVEAWAYDVEDGSVCRLEGGYRVDP